MTIEDILKLLATAGNVTVNITVNNDVDDDEVVDDTPETDFSVGDRVLVCHVRRNGDRVHTVGTVSTACGHDDKGWYTRVDGDNGKHYRAGLTYNEERLGTIIYRLEA